MSKKLVMISACAAICLGTIIGTYKDVAHNVMSHHPVDMTNKEILHNLPKLIFIKGKYDGIPDYAKKVPNGTDMNAIYLGKQKNPFPESKYRPSSATHLPGTKFYDPLDMVDFHIERSNLECATYSTLNRIKDLKKGEIFPLKQEGSLSDSYFWSYGGGLFDMKEKGPIEGFGNFTLSIGYDNRGKYVSFYDIFDFSEGKGGYYNMRSDLVTKLTSLILPNIGTPIFFYKRWYFDESRITDKIIEEIIQKRE